MRSTRLRILLPVCVCAVLMGCSRRAPRPEPPGFAELPPVPKASEFGASEPETLAWRERLRQVYRALGPEAHWTLKEKHEVRFRLNDLPKEQRAALTEYLARDGIRDWVESKVGRPPDLGRLTFAFAGSPGSTVRLAIPDPADPKRLDLMCDDIGGWPAEPAPRGN